MCIKSHFFQLSMISTLLIASLNIGMANNKPKPGKAKPAAPQAQETKQELPATIKGSDAPAL